MLDMFGVRLSVGQWVIYADAVGDSGPELAILKIDEMADGVIIGEQMNGDAVGRRFYLTDPHKRMVVVGRDRGMYNAVSCYQETVVS